MTDTGFLERDGLIYRRWVPAKREAEEVLPKDYRHNVLHIAHTRWTPWKEENSQESYGQVLLTNFVW